MESSSSANQPGGSGEFDTTEADRALLRAYREQTQLSEVQRLLDELLPYLDRVAITDTGPGGRGGNTVRAGDDRYQVTFGGADLDQRDRIATLVHELTHVGVQEAYDADMLNYSAPPLGDEARARMERETPGREEDVQNARMGQLPVSQRMEFMDHVMDGATRLAAALPTSGLSPDVQEPLREKLLNHMRPRPYHEYDGVLSHALVLCDTYNADTSSEFYKLLSRLVQQAAGWRNAGTVSLPAPGAGAGAEAGAGRRRELAQKALAILKKLKPRRG
ncbi:hypothetical protein [Streptomyces sp. NPDC002690]